MVVVVGNIKEQWTQLSNSYLRPDVKTATLSYRPGLHRLLLIGLASIPADSTFSIPKTSITIGGDV